MIKLRNLDPSLRSMALEAAGLIPGAADLRYICASGGQALTYWGQQAPDRVHNTIAASHAAMTSGRNDVAILSPDSHSQAAGLTWDKNLCHLVGAYGPAMMNHRSRIGHSANFATLLTVSGYGNTFANLYFMHGRGNAANLNCLDVTGPRNSFINCHFGGPMHATEGGTLRCVVNHQKTAQAARLVLEGDDLLVVISGHLFENRGLSHRVIESSGHRAIESLGHCWLARGALRGRKDGK